MPARRERGRCKHTAWTCSGHVCMCGAAASGLNSGVLAHMAAPCHEATHGTRAGPHVVMNAASTGSAFAAFSCAASTSFRRHNVVAASPHCQSTLRSTGFKRVRRRGPSSTLLKNKLCEVELWS